MAMAALKKLALPATCDVKSDVEKLCFLAGGGVVEKPTLTSSPNLNFLVTVIGHRTRLQLIIVASCIYSPCRAKT